MMNPCTKSWAMLTAAIRGKNGPGLGPGPIRVIRGSQNSESAASQRCLVVFLQREDRSRVSGG